MSALKGMAPSGDLGQSTTIGGGRICTPSIAYPTLRVNPIPLPWIKNHVASLRDCTTTLLDGRARLTWWERLALQRLAGRLARALDVLEVPRG